MKLKICPICRSLYPDDFTKCSSCNEELIPNDVYKKWGTEQKNKQQQKYKPKYEGEPSTVKIKKSAMPTRPETDVVDLNLNIPKCPICQSTDLSKISSLHKAGKILMFGIFGMDDNGKTWKCNNCGSKF